MSEKIDAVIDKDRLTARTLRRGDIPIVSRLHHFSERDILSATEIT